MIHGIGTDLVSIARIARALARHGERFARRILAETEVAQYAASAQPARFVAKRFAVKEAYAKAFGTGIGAELTWHDIRIAHDARGKPLIQPSPQLAMVLADRGLLSCHVSLSDETDMVVAFVIIERNP